MLRIAICCGEGFSSGFFARHLQKETEKEGLDKEVSFTFIPFYQLHDRQDEVDAAIIMPHMEEKVRNSKDTFTIPMYPLPFKVAVKPSVRDYMEDVEDIITLANGRGGLFTFPGEERTALVSRLVSHRQWLRQNA